jgi:hypothetical protein
MYLLNYFLLCYSMLENKESKPAWEELRGLSWLVSDDE